MAEFDLSQLMQDVSKSDTSREQIRYIAWASIRPAENNGYSMDGLEELARSIELVGLQQPLRVRPLADNSVEVISGHRRRAAIGLLIDRGSPRFDAGVPCIVDASAASPALRELQLLLGNADNRKLTSADAAQQAERISDCIRRLEDEGYEFPGRHRDWVAKLSGMSRSKLARLKVIRDRLEPSIRKAYYDPGKLSEDAAYKLAQLPAEHQRRVVAWYRVQTKMPELWHAHTIEKYGEDLARLETLHCPEYLGGTPCNNREALLEKIWEKGYHGYTDCAYDKCCADCRELASCRSVCKEMKPKADKLKAQSKAAKQQQKTAEAREEATKAEKVRNLWLHFGNALARANMEDADLRKRVDGTRLWRLTDEEVAMLEAGELEKVKSSTSLPFGNTVFLDDVERLVKIADALDCSLDYLLCRTDDTPSAGNVSESDTPPEWGTGKPPKPGLYAVRFKVSETAPGEIHNFARWTGWNWQAARSGKVITDIIAAAWYQIPELDA